MDILNPLFVQVALTFTLLFMMGRSRVGKINSKEVHPKDVALRQPNWPQETTKFANAFHNQLETPILFYVLVILLFITKQADYLQIILAWGYVAARIVHAVIHIKSNRLSPRFMAFFVSIIILLIMWVRFFIAINF